MRKYVTEFIGTFFLVLTVGLTVLGGTPLAPLAIGAVAHGHGLHGRPRVRRALQPRRDAGGVAPRQDPFRGARRVYAQSVLRARWPRRSSCTRSSAGRSLRPPPRRRRSPGALTVEVLYTFALALVVLNSAVTAKTKGNSYYGLAIGFTVVVAAFAGGPISGGAFNPAVGVGTDPGARGTQRWVARSPLDLPRRPARRWRARRDRVRAAGAGTAVRGGGPAPGRQESRRVATGRLTPANATGCAGTSLAVTAGIWKPTAASQQRRPLIGLGSARTRTTART